MITLFGKSEPSLLERLKQSVGKTRSELSARVEEIFKGEKKIEPVVLSKLENVLLAADLGVRTTRDVLAAVRDKVDRHVLSDAAHLKQEIKAQLVSILSASDDAAPATPPVRGEEVAENGAAPRVIFVVGVNGTGKTTSIGKLAKRNGVELVKQRPGADPAAVVYDAVAAGRARSADAVIVDTAGRLHTKSNLMAELEKMKRTAAKVVPGAPHDVLLVMDATTGQNGLSQAREFTSSVGVTGIILTKLDGTAKGGIVIAIARELGLPIRFVGTGEQIGDLVPFDPQTFVNSLFD